MVNVADEYGIESSNISKKLFPAAGFDIVFDKSYPLGTQDYAPVIKAAKGTNPDAFIAWSYPPDTFGLTDQAKIENFNVKVYYNGIGCAFAGFSGKYGGSAENVIGFGGIPDNEKTRAFLKLHKEVTGVDADYNACPYFYANGQTDAGIRRRGYNGPGCRHRVSQEPYLQNLDRRGRPPQSAAEHRLYRRPMAEWLLQISGRRGRPRVRLSARPGEDQLGMSSRHGLSSRRGSIGAKTAVH
jgi:Periplasmic binding protein